MNELNEVYASYDSKNREYSKEEYAEYKKKEKQEVYNLIDKTEERVVTNGEELKKYLDTQSKFDQYSVGNAMLVLAQMPNATQLRDYNGWQNVGGYVKKSPKKVKILEPADSYMREDGTVGTNYNVKKVYDITQVNIKDRARQMKYDNKILLKLFLQSSNAKVEVVDYIPNTDKKAMYDMNNDTLYIAKGAEAPSIFYEVTQEIAMQEIGEDTLKSYCVSYMLCKKYNIDVSNYNFENVAISMQSMDAKQIREELEPIRNAMENINSRITENIKQLARESKAKER